MNPYQPASPEGHPEQIHPDFRLVWMRGARKAVVVAAGFVSLLVGAGLIVFQLRINRGGGMFPPSVILAALGLGFLWLAFLFPRVLTRRYRMLSPAVSGEAVRAGQIVWYDAAGRPRPGVLFLSQRDLIFFRGPWQKWQDDQVSRYSLKDVVAPTLRSAKPTGSRASFTDAEGNEVSLFLPNREEWFETIRDYAAKIPAAV